MSYEIVVTQQAKSEITEIAEYIEQHSPQAAERWVPEILDAIGTLAEFPDGHPFARENCSHDRELRQLSHGRYRIIFFVDIGRVVVASVRHSSRLPHAPGTLD